VDLPNQRALSHRALFLPGSYNKIFRFFPLPTFLDSKKTPLIKIPPKKQTRSNTNPNDDPGVGSSNDQDIGTSRETSAEDTNLDGTSEISDAPDSRLLQLLREAQLPTRIANIINLDLAEKDITDESNSIHCNSFAASRIHDYLTIRRCHGTELLSTFQEDFTGWTEQTFGKLNKDVIRGIRSALRYKGVYPGGKRGNVTDQLLEVMSLEHPLVWPAEELVGETFAPETRAFQFQGMLEQGLPLPRVSTPVDVPKDKGKAVHYPQQTNPQGQTVGNQEDMNDEQVLPSTERPTPAPDASGVIRSTPYMEHGTSYPFSKPNPPSAVRPQRTYQRSSFPLDTVHQEYSPREANFPRDAVQPEFGQQRVSLPPGAVHPDFVPQRIPIFSVPPSLPPPRQEYAPTNMYQPSIYQANDLPPPEVESEPIEPNVMVSFRKFWQKEDSYTGEAYDILDDRVRIFIRNCKSVGIRPSQYAAIFGYTLQGAAKDYVLHNVPEEATFRKQYLLLKAHFDTEVNHTAY
jgi:hypothetical protein